MHTCEHLLCPRRRDHCSNPVCRRLIFHFLASLRSSLPLYARPCSMNAPVMVQLSGETDPLEVRGRGWGREGGEEGGAPYLGGRWESWR